MRKRQVTVLKSLSRPAEAILALVELLKQSPADAEAWAELAELYSGQEMHKQAIFCLEEVLLIMPNAWNVCITRISSPRLLTNYNRYMHITAKRYTCML